MSHPAGIVSRISELRESAGLTQAQLAVLVGVTTNTIQNWENSKSGVDRIIKFLKLCEILDCGLEDLVKEVDSRKGEQQKVGSFSLKDLRTLREKWGTEDKAPSKSTRKDCATEAGKQECKSE